MEQKKNQITLIRHGEPEVYQKFSLWTISSGKELESFLRQYNVSKIIPSDSIPSTLKEIVSTGDLYISSGLKRTHESFQLLNVKEYTKNDLFNEADLPCGIGKTIRMPLIVWLIVLRVLWRLGVHAKSESFRDFITRMRACADFLDGKKNGAHTVVMAHGFVNRTLKKELSRKGWRLLANRGGGGYWSFSTFEKDSV